MAEKNLNIWKKIIKEDFKNKLNEPLRKTSLRDLRPGSRGYTFEQLQNLSVLFFQKYTRDRGDEYPSESHDLGEMIENGLTKRNCVVFLNRFCVIKFPDENDEGYDSIFQETAIGLQVNRIRSVCPNFVYTIGMIRTEPPSSIQKYYRKKYYHCVVSEHINGENLSKSISKNSFENYYSIYLQVWLALALAQSLIGLTHYDLHCGNVMIIPQESPITIEYPWGFVNSKYLVKIIDWGRSFSYGNYRNQKCSIGKVRPSLGIQVGPNYFYDCFFLLRNGPPSADAKHFIDFFKITANQNVKNHSDLIEISNRSYDWFEWFHLITTHPFARNCFTRKDQIEKLPNPLFFPKISLPKDYTFYELENYLSDWRTGDFEIAKKQRGIEQNRIALLRETKKILTQNSVLPKKLMKPDLNNITQEGQEKIISSLNEIARVNQSRDLIPYYDYFIEIIFKRLDFLNRLISFESR